MGPCCRLLCMGVSLHFSLVTASTSAGSQQRLRGKQAFEGPRKERQNTTLPQEQTQRALQQSPDADCALSGFWAIGDDVVARFWRMEYDLGLYEYVGRGQCKDGGGRVYGSWSTTSGGATFDQCRMACDASSACVGFEFSEAGVCSVRYDIEGLPLEAPKPFLTEHHDGDDGTGPVVSTSKPWGQVCYRKHPEAASQIASKSVHGHFWRVMYYPRQGVWAYGDGGTKEAALEVGEERPEDLQQCKQQAPSTAAKAPFAQGVSVWWGTNEMSMWAGIPTETPSPPTWQGISDIRAWDPSAALGGGSHCPEARDIRRLVGQWQSVQHAVWGWSGCKATEFGRLAPELAELSDDGLLEVIRYRWKFGLEIFIRRVIMAEGYHIVDEDCFQTKLLDKLWPSTTEEWWHKTEKKEKPLASLTWHLTWSRCTRRNR